MVISAVTLLTQYHEYSAYEDYFISEIEIFASLAHFMEDPDFVLFPKFDFEISIKTIFNKLVMYPFRNLIVYSLQMNEYQSVETKQPLVGFFDGGVICNIKIL